MRATQLMPGFPRFSADCVIMRRPHKESFAAVNLYYFDWHS